MLTRKETRALFRGVGALLVDDPVEGKAIREKLATDMEPDIASLREQLVGALATLSELSDKTPASREAVRRLAEEERIAGLTMSEYARESLAGFDELLKASSMLGMEREPCSWCGGKGRPCTWCGRGIEFTAGGPGGRGIEREWALDDFISTFDDGKVSIDYVFQKVMANLDGSFRPSEVMRRITARREETIKK